MSLLCGLWYGAAERALRRGGVGASLSLWLAPRRVGLIATQSFRLTARPGLSEGSGLRQRVGLSESSADAEFSADAKFVHPLSQCGSGDSQEFGGLDLVALGFFERLNN